MQESRALHYILGTSLLMIAVFAVSAFVMVNSQAVDPQAEVTITNVNPTVATKFISASPNPVSDGFAGGTIDLVGGGTRTVYVGGLVADNNGEGDISDVDLTLFRSGVAGGGAACTPDANDCYRVDNCTLSTGAGTSLQVGYNCQVPLEYYTDSTSAGGDYAGENWVVGVSVTDTSGGNAVDTALTKEVETRTSLIIAGNISFPGTLALGTNTTAADNVAFNIPQGGNDVADVEVSMGATTIPCLKNAVSSGSIPRVNLIWSPTDVDYNGSGATGLTGSPAPVDINVPVRTGAQTARNVFWNIQIPATGVSGTCSGAVTITAIAG